MKILSYAAAAALLSATAAESQTPIGPSSAIATPPLVHSRAQAWYSDTGWQAGYGPLQAYGYGYGYGGAGQRPPVMIAAPQQPIREGEYGYGAVTRSMPFGYPVDGFGRYPWSRWRGADSQGEHASSPVRHGPGPIPFSPSPAANPEQGDFAAPAPSGPSSTERPYAPYAQEPGERG